MIVYPLEKEEAGHHTWPTMHHRAALYPDNPTEQDKKRMKIFLLESMRNVAELCKDCKKHIHDYLKSHPLVPALVSKKAISKYLCEFHNHVNERTGKEIHNCHLILGKKPKPECKDCKVPVPLVKKESHLRTSFDSFKDASVKVFHALCDKYKLPYPEIKFNECPNDSTASCTSFWIDQKTQNIVEKPVVYLHPNLFGLRTIVHEFMHYIKTLSKDTIGSIDEESVERDAQSILKEEFPYDRLSEDDLKTERKPPAAAAVEAIANVVVRKDAVSSPSSKLALFPNSYRVFEKHLKNVKRRDFVTQPIDQEGDLVWDMISGITGGGEGGSEGLEQVESERFCKQERYNHTLSFLDGLYGPFAGLFGIQASDMNRNNTPIIISNAAIALMRSNLSSIGSLLLTTLTSIGIYGALTLGKNGISYGDKLLMNSFGAQLLWSGIEYARPDYKQEIVEDAIILGEAVSRQQWGIVPKILFGETPLGALVGETSTASPLSAARNLQRASISSAGGGSIGGGGGRSSRTAVDIRNLQRAGEWTYTPSGTPSTQDVYTRAAASAGNPRYSGRQPIERQPSSVNTVYGYDDNSAVIIPSDEEEVYESAFGGSVSDGSKAGGGIITDDISRRRNTIKDVFEYDPYYDNFNDEFMETDVY